jgi:hypothetical protein
MKFNIKKFIFRNKKTLLFLGALFLGVMIFISFYKIKEGFDNSSIGEYAYLKPVPANNTWSQATLDAFKIAYKKNQETKLGDNYDSMEKAMIDSSTEEEGQYYISNNKFPWGSYITNAWTNYLKANPMYTNGASIEDAVKNSMQAQNTRQTYVLLRPAESQQTPQPLSYQIYMGTAQPPASPSAPSSATPSPSLSPSPSSLSSTDYQSLTSICKNMLAANTA